MLNLALFAYFMLTSLKNYGHSVAFIESWVALETHNFIPDAFEEVLLILLIYEKKAKFV